MRAGVQAPGAPVGAGGPLRICFFAPVRSRGVLDRTDFYAQDIRLLRELGHEVVITTKFRELPGDCDLYFVWWWTWAFYPVLRARLARRPVLVTGTFNYNTPPRGASANFVDRPWWQRALIRFALAAADMNVFVSEYELAQVPSHLRARRPRYLPHAIDVERYAPTGEPREPFLFNVAWSGPVNAIRKCLPDIVSAMPRILARHPQARLVMAGSEGAYLPQLRALAAELGVADRVEFLGAISEERKIDLMRRCAAYVQPTRFEGFGLAIAEAMACGTPVITSRVGAVPEVVGDAALFVVPGDAIGLADAASRLLTDPAFGARLGAAARARVVEQFSLERKRDALAALLSELVPDEAAHRASPQAPYAPEQSDALADAGLAAPRPTRAREELGGC